MRNLKNTTIVTSLFNGLTARKAALTERIAAGEQVSIATEIKTMLDRFDPLGRSHKSFLHAVENTKSVFDFEPLMKMIAKDAKSSGVDCNYMQCKSLLKVVQFVESFGNKNFKTIDGYTSTILLNCIANAGSIKAQTAFVSLAKGYESDDELSEKIVSRRGHTAGTASTQISSTKELFRALGLTENVKGVRDAPIAIKADAVAALVEHFEQLA